jgi:hypothetical protein
VGINATEIKLNLILALKGKYGMPTAAWLEDHISYDEIRCIDFLVNNKIITKPEQCDEDGCGGQLYLRTDSIKYYRCSRKACRKSISILNSSIFFKSRIPCNDIMRIAYLVILGNLL